MPVIELSESTYKNLTDFMDLIRPLAQGRKMTPDLAVTELIAAYLRVLQSKEYGEVITKDAISRFKEFQEENK
jgi:hypothetical protein